MNERKYLLQYLPVYENKAELIKENQEVNDIIKEVLTAHNIFAKDYVNIAAYFFDKDPVKFLENIFDFLKENIKYKIEPEDLQQTKSAAALLQTGCGDCKHYAGFIAGNVCAYETITGEKLNGVYRFASYEFFNTTPGHVFIVCKIDGKDIWIDPVLKSFNSRSITPSYYIDKKIKCNTMALQRLSGLPITQQLTDSILLLAEYGILDANNKRLNEGLYNDLLLELPSIPGANLRNAYNTFTSSGTNSMGSFWSDLWDTAQGVIKTFIGGGNGTTGNGCPQCQVCPPVVNPIQAALPFILGAGVLGYIVAKKNIF